MKPNSWVAFTWKATMALSVTTVSEPASRTGASITTVTSEESLLAPDTAKIQVLPGAIGFTLPSATLAMAALREDQVRVLPAQAAPTGVKEVSGPPEYSLTASGLMSRTVVS